MLLRRLVTAVLDSADGLAQLLAAGDDAVDAKFLHLFAAHGIKRHGDGSAAAHGDRPGQLLRPFVGDGLKDAAVALLVHQRHRRCLDTADGKGHHLQFRKARPMPSTSTIGIFSLAAAAMGSMEPTPPASMGIKA